MAGLIKINSLAYILKFNLNVNIHGKILAAVNRDGYRN